MGEDRTISEEEFAKWVTPADTVLRLPKIPPRSAIIQIFQRLKCGHLRAIARRVTQNQKSSEFREIGTQLWKKAESGITASDFWPTGDITIYVPEHSYSSEEVATYLFGVRFDPVGLDEFAPIPMTVSAAVPAQSILPPPKDQLAKEIPDRGGRPPKEWWDDLWIEIFRQIYNGTLIPKTKADIAKAMLDWAAAHEHKMGETIAKAAARKLFIALNEEGQKGSET